MKNILERLNEIQTRSQEINRRKTEIRSVVTAGGEGIDIEALTTEVNNLNTEQSKLDSEKSQLEQRKAVIEGLNNGAIQGRSLGNPFGIEQKTPNVKELEMRTAFMRTMTGLSAEEVEKRAKSFMNGAEKSTIIGADAVKRSLTIASGGVAVPTRVGDIQEGQNIVSGIIDMVNVVDANGMGVDKVPYVKTELAAGVGTDGTAPTASDVGFGVATIEPILINTLSYVSKHIDRLTPVNYQERVVKSALTALRAKISKQIVAGDPNAATKEICGIINATAIESAKDLSISAIDATTLRKIALGYGGDENLEGNCVLVLNKKDLMAFGDVRGEKEKKAVYEITFDAGSSTTGVIKDGGLAVKFCINSQCKALSDSGTAADSYTMVYGKALTYQLDLFGNYDISVSKDYKFGEGLLAVLGEVMVGGNVVAHNGWTRVKKVAAAG